MKTDISLTVRTMPVSKSKSTNSYHHGDLRRALIDAAFETIRTEGIQNLSLRGLAKRAGVSHAAPGRHFVDKAALMTALATESVALMANYLSTAYRDTEGSVAERNRAMGAAFVRFALENPAHFKIQVRRELFDADNGEFVDSVHAMTGALRTAVDDLQRLGAFAGRDPNLIVAMYMSLVTGVSILWLDGMLTHVTGATNPIDVINEISEIVVPEPMSDP